jgi:chemotaxis protein histidine kinase CheA
MHRIKGEAATLGLVTVEARAHEFEDLLGDLRGRPQLSGSDFLPLVVRLDDMFGHLRSVRELVVRVDGMRADQVLSNRDAAGSAARPPAAPFESLAQRVAADQGKSIRLVSSGLDEVPGDYRKALRDIVTQLVRNAVVHGIEDAGTRRNLGKDETGLLQVEFKRSEAGCELVFQDDGGGIVAERIRETAVARGVIGAEEAKALDSKAVLALIFRPGFSTHGAGDRDAGRGVGLDLVRRMVQSLGGRISVATAPGKYTRFRVLLPAGHARRDAVA